MTYHIRATRSQTRHSLFWIATIYLALTAFGYLTVLLIDSWLSAGSGMRASSQAALRLGLCAIFLPYAASGVLLGWLRISSFRFVALMGLVTTIGERLFVLGAAAMILQSFRQVLPSGEVIYVEGNPNLLLAVRTEALPYYDWFYLIWGIPLSIGVLYLSVQIARRWVIRQQV